MMTMCNQEELYSLFSHTAAETLFELCADPAHLGGVPGFSSLNKEQIETIRAEYEKDSNVDADILFAFHSLNDGSKKAFLSMVAGMLMQDCNIKIFNENMDKAT